MFLLTLKGQVTVHFIDDRTLQGEIMAQDSLNIFLTSDQQPVMISRSQIRYIKGASGQTVEPDTRSQQAAQATPEQAVTLEAGRERVKTTPSIWDTDVSNLEPDTLLPIRDDQAAPLFVEEEEDATMLLDVGEDSDPTLFVEQEEEDDATISFNESDEDGTLVINDSQTIPVITAYLECTGGPHAGQRFELKPEVTTLGRSSDNIIVLSSDKEISRRHAQISYQEDGTFVIEDRGSLNGVIINEIRIEAPYTLQTGDNVLIGISTMVFREG